MDLSITKARRERLKALLREKDIPAMLVSYAANRYYLSGFELHDGQCNETSGWLAITADGDDYLFTDPRYEEAAKKVWDENNVCIYSAARHKTVGEYLKKHGITRIAFEPEAMSIFDYEGMNDHVNLKSQDGLVEKLRVIKDADELHRMQVAMDLNHRLFEYIEGQLIPGRTEAEISWEVEKFFRENGAEGMAFSTIVGVGPNAALPHARPGETVIREGELVLIDTGCRCLEYNSDQTRTFWVGGEPSDRFKKTLAQVQGAQQAAIDVLRPGLTMKDGYMAAWNYLEKEGVAEAFNHGLGHGIGLETHEAPRLSKFAEGVLEPGMVVTVEPGVYYPDWGGIRWEHQVVITEDGCRVM